MVRYRAGAGVGSVQTLVDDTQARTMTHFSESNRRDFLRRMAAGTGSMIMAPSLMAAMSACRMPGVNSDHDPDGWDRVPLILKRIVPPSFPARDFDITRYGAKGDGATD